MSGTFIINSNSSHDVRTIDFRFLIEILRGEIRSLELKHKVFMSYDEAGMNIVNVKELNETEYREFVQCMGSVRDKIKHESMDGLSAYLDQLILSLKDDARYC